MSNGYRAWDRLLFSAIMSFYVAGIFVSFFLFAKGMLIATQYYVSPDDVNVWMTLGNGFRGLVTAIGFGSASILVSILLLPFESSRTQILSSARNPLRALRVLSKNSDEPLGR